MSFDFLADLDLLGLSSPRAASPLVFCGADADTLDVLGLFDDELFELPSEPAGDTDADSSGSPALAGAHAAALDEQRWGDMLRLSATEMNRLKRTGRLAPDELLELTRARRRRLNREYSRASRQRRTGRAAALRTKAELQRQVQQLTVKVAALEAALAHQHAA